MSRLLSDLAPAFRPKAYELLARFVEAKVPVLIVCTGRTQAEQDAALAAGTSKVKRSKHQDGLAIDVVPYAVYEAADRSNDKLLWDTRSPLWTRLGLIGEQLGLTWGGRWKSPHDPGHFELIV